MITNTAYGRRTAELEYICSIKILESKLLKTFNNLTDSKETASNNSIAILTTKTGELTKHVLMNIWHKLCKINCNDFEEQPRKFRVGIKYII